MAVLSCTRIQSWWSFFKKEKKYFFLFLCLGENFSFSLRSDPHSSSFKNPPPPSTSALTPSSSQSSSPALQPKNSFHNNSSHFPRNTNTNNNMSNIANHNPHLPKAISNTVSNTISNTIISPFDFFDPTSPLVHCPFTATISTENPYAQVSSSYSDAFVLYLKNYLRRLLSFFPQGPQTVLPTFTSKTSEAFLVRHLWYLGYMPKKWTFSPHQPLPRSLLSRGLRNFQKAHHLDITGTLTEETLEILNEPLGFIFDDIQHTLEQWQKLQPLPYFYVMVNIPSYTLWVINHSNVLLESPVVVGKASNIQKRTPLLQTVLSSAILWPQWVAPKSLQQSMGLSAQKQGYFMQNGCLVRRSGSGNPLGCVKFQTNIGAFLLHDTNQPHYFSKTRRDLSSGCIRVKNYEGLIKILFPSSYGVMMETIRKKRTKSFSLKPTVPLLTTYLLMLPAQKKDDFLGPYRYEDIYKQV